MRITSLHSYPVKGCRRLDHHQAHVEPWGLAGDRRWIVIDAEGVGITQRVTARLALLSVTPRPGGLTLAAPGMPDLDVDEPADGPKEFIRVFRHKSSAPARLAVAATDWFTSFLAIPARLAWQADPTGRAIEHDARESDRVSFADGYPMLLTSTASLA